MKSIMKSSRRLIATTTATLALVASAGLLSTSAAFAQDNGPAGQPGVGCPVEDTNGTVTIVPIGTKIGPFSCGVDGEWHLVWRVAPAKGGIKASVLQGGSRLLRR